MKKFLSTTFFSLLLCLSGVLLVACGEDKTKESYYVNIPSSSDYTITVDGKELSSFTANEGDEIALTVTVDAERKAIDSVLFNSTPCTFTDGVYKFTMPAEDVNITVNLADVLMEVLTDDVLSWSKSVPDQISMKEEGLSYNPDYRFNFNFSESVNISNKAKDITITSSNQNVIPDDAFTVNLTSSNKGTMMSGGEIVISTENINAGETYITLHVKPSSYSTNVDATIIKRVEVVPYGELPAPTYWKETLTLDLSKISSKDLENGLLITVSDNNWLYGSGVTSFQEWSFTVDDLDNDDCVTLEINYVQNHEFTVSLMPLTEGGSFTGASFELNETIGEGDSVNGFNQYVDGILTFVTPNSELTIKASGDMN